MIINRNKSLNTKITKTKKPLKSSLKSKSKSKSMIGSKLGIIRNLSKQNLVSAKFRKLILK